MPYVSVPKDLTSVKTKLAFGLTKRQIICFSLAAGAGVPIYLWVKSSMGNSVAVVLLIVAALPFLFLAMYEKNGQPFEKIVWNILRAKLICPAMRPYQSENIYQAVQSHTELQKEVRRIVKETVQQKKRKEKSRKEKQRFFG